MREPPLILIVDDSADNREILEWRLQRRGYATATAEDGEAALVQAAALRHDLILLDVMMPKLDGLEVCRRLKGDPALPFMPIILVTARTALEDVVAGLEAGADDYLTKPVEHAALIARVRSMLRIKALHDEVQAQKAELAAWNVTLEQRVAEQVAEIERIGRLKRFLAPQVAELVVSGEGEAMLESHRARIVVVFVDLRGFTAFAETAPPEAVMQVLRDFHAAAGPLIHAYEGTLERFLGDGLMVIFNDPVPCPDAAPRAVRMAVALRCAFAALAERWQEHGSMLGLGIGIAEGEATLGRIGFEGRWDYAAIGTVANLAARLCAEAKDGEILVSEPVARAAHGIARIEPLGETALKGFQDSVPVYAVLGLEPIQGEPRSSPT